MAYKSSFYYDDGFDYDSYQDSLDYDGQAEHLPTIVDVVNCGFAVGKQISIQLMCLLCVNFIYRLIRRSSECFTVFMILFVNNTNLISQTSMSSSSICLLLCLDISPLSSSSRPATSLSRFSLASRMPSWNFCNILDWRRRDSLWLHFK